MSAPEVTKVAITVASTEAHTEIVTQYGCRFPDGSIDWDVTQSDPNALRPFVIKHLLNTPQMMEQWKKDIVRRASGANVDPKEYLEGHSFVKRTLVIAVTAPEEHTP